MKTVVTAWTWLCALSGVLGCFAGHGKTSTAQSERATSSEPRRTIEAAATPLEFGELLKPSPILEPSDRARSLSGSRVRVVGFMAEMEEARKGAFYLVPRPLRCDEGGGGTGDLPPQSILVSVRLPLDREIPHLAGLLEATGVFEVGNQVDEAGRVSAFRIALEGLPDARAVD